MEKIDYNFDIVKLQKELSTLLGRVPLHFNQLCLMHKENCNDPYYYGCGSLTYDGGYTTGKQTRRTIIHSENEFYIFNKELTNTYSHTVYTELSKHYKLARLRIMALDQKTCLSWHRDVDRRIHIPIATDEKCKFVLEDEVFFLPADGNAYIVDTRKFHTVFNGSGIVRTHLVASILE